MKLPSSLALLSALLITVACSSSTTPSTPSDSPDSTNKPDSTNTKDDPTKGADGGSTPATEGEVAETPASTVTCDDVCTNVAKCGVDASTCNNVCSKLSLACKGCLAKATCQDDCIPSTCGNISKTPKKAPQPAPSAKCDALTFTFSKNKPQSSASPAGWACTVPWECRSQACVSGDLGGKLVSFCASETDCRETDSQLSDPCPTGWKCAEVADSQAANGTTRWSCVPPDADPCAPGELQY